MGKKEINLQVNNTMTENYKEAGVSGPARGRNGQPLSYEELKNLLNQQAQQIEMLMSRLGQINQNDEVYKKLTFNIKILELVNNNEFSKLFSSDFAFKLAKEIEEMMIPPQEDEL